VITKKAVLDCINLFCFMFTFGVLFSYVWKGEVTIELPTFVAAAFVAGRLLRLAFTGKPVMPVEEANG
jgi:hypothetical protein